MSIDWENLSKKELFKLKLKGTTPKFGYISSSKRAKFVQFLVKNGFFKYVGSFQDLVEIANKSNPGPNVTGVDHYLGLYTVESSFTYEDLGSGPGHVSAYRATERTVTEGHRFVTDKSHRLSDMGPGVGMPY